MRYLCGLKNAMARAGELADELVIELHPWLIKLRNTKEKGSCLISYPNMVQILDVPLPKAPRIPD